MKELKDVEVGRWEKGNAENNIINWAKRRGYKVTANFMHMGRVEYTFKSGVYFLSNFKTCKDGTLLATFTKVSA